MPPIVSGNSSSFSDEAAIRPERLAKARDEPGRSLSWVGMGSADDTQLWDFARDHGFTIVSKDEDFNLLSLARGFPPKVLWLMLGNCTTQQEEDALRADYAAIEALAIDPGKGTLIIR